MTVVGKCPNWTSPNYCGYIISNRYLVWWCSKSPKRNIYHHLPTPESNHCWLSFLVLNPRSWGATKSVKIHVFSCTAWYLLDQTSCSSQKKPGKNIEKMLVGKAMACLPPISMDWFMEELKPESHDLPGIHGFRFGFSLRWPSGLMVYAIKNGGFMWFPKMGLPQSSSIF